MRILNVLAQKPDSTGSGVYLRETVACEVAQGNEVAVLCGVNAGDDVEPFAPGVRVATVQFNTPELPFYVCGMSDVMPYPATRYRDLTPEMQRAWEGAFKAALTTLVAEFKPDVIVIHHLYLLCAVTLETLDELGVYIPCVAISHATDLRQLANHGLARERIGAAVRQLAAVGALHEALAMRIEELFDVPAERVCLVGTGYDPAHFNQGGVDLAQKCPVNAALRVLYVGKICHAKGVIELIHAADALYKGGANLELRLAGGWGTSEREVADAKAAIAEASVPVTLLGRIENGELLDEYRHANVFCLPSYYEGLPLVLVEALACGAKVVATDLPGVRGWLVNTLPEVPAWWVTPPAMKTLDTPLVEELPAFEARLAQALNEALLAGEHTRIVDPDGTVRAATWPCTTNAASWDAVTQRLLAALPH
jgi:glycosyltransferase involved in cell wall biosynthesis